MTDDGGALTRELDIATTRHGPLAGKRFVVKENIDVAGVVSTNGHPLWRETHATAGATAPAALRALDAGARLVGKAHMDEMAYSLLGANPHFGTPRNPKAPERHPGGSSSGCAVAVASGLADFALGTDTAGSCRAPAAFCGVFGFRPSHGAVSSNGVAPLAMTLDAIGWFARDMETMIAVGEALLPADLTAASVQRLLAPQSFFAACDDDAAPVFADACQALRREHEVIDVTFDEDYEAQALTHFRNLQAFEGWEANGAWIEREKPQFGAGVAERFAYAASVTRAQKAAADAFRAAHREKIDALLGDRLFVLPTAPIRAPRLDEDAKTLDDKRYRMMKLFLLASFFGLPQISLPLSAPGAPLGLSLIGPRWSDRGLLALARALAARL
jgi:amidase